MNNSIIKQLFFIAALVLTFTTCKQKKNFAQILPVRNKIDSEKIPENKDEIERKSHNCIEKSKDDFTTRLKNYPFNSSAQIQIVSFKSDYLPRLNDKLFYSKLTEVKTLTFSQVDKLTDILYNYGYGGEVYIVRTANCYMPRNAILFLDSNGKVFEFIEICFECRNTRESSEKISLGEMCDQKMSMLKDFFKTAGIQYGVIE